MAKILKALGFLESGHLVEVDLSGLVAGYIGQTALKVADVVNKSLGGVLFVDEAYSLSAGEGQDFGREAIETLLTEINGRSSRTILVVIVAGYTDKMAEFLNLILVFSRASIATYISRTTLLDNLLEIFTKFARRSDLILSPRASDKLLSVFQLIYQSRDKAFGNARLARNMFEFASGNQASRIVSLKNISDKALTKLRLTTFRTVHDGSDEQIFGAKQQVPHQPTRLTSSLTFCTFGRLR